jgi:N-acetylglucosaminyldiphosphoundecaprenol N-acetyl-beta-D-mannosaminyltransferase
MDLSNPENKLPTIPVTGTLVTALPLCQQIEVMIAWARQRSSRVVCVANVHMLMESRWNSELRSVLESADLTTPDGMPLVWMMRALGARNQDRVAGFDIFLAVCQEAVNYNISIYLLGSTQEVLNKVLVKLKHQFPDIKIAGADSPPFRPMTQVEDSEITERINNSGAGVTFVALGCPKQECWMAAHHGKISSVMVGVGAVFPVYAGLKKHAPKWIREIGLEWLYRLLQEPKRLSWRYLKTIPPFIWFALQQLGLERLHQRSLKS